MEHGVLLTGGDRMPGHLATLITVFDMPSGIINSIFFSFYLYLSAYSPLLHLFCLDFSLCVFCVSVALFFLIAGTKGRSGLGDILIEILRKYHE